MRRRCFCFVLAMCSGLAGKASATERPNFVDDIRQILATRGATRAVAQMSATGDWGRFIDRVSSGDIGAIILARELSKGTDAGASEDITIGLAEALPKAPRHVLGVLISDPNGTLSYSQVCSAPFIEDTPKHQRTYKAAALRAVRRVVRSRDPDLTLPSKLCIAELKRIKS